MSNASVANVSGEWKIRSDAARTLVIDDCAPVEALMSEVVKLNPRLTTQLEHAISNLINEHVHRALVAGYHLAPVLACRGWRSILDSVLESEVFLQCAWSDVNALIGVLRGEAGGLAYDLEKAISARTYAVANSAFRAGAGALQRPAGSGLEMTGE